MMRPAFRRIQLAYGCHDGDWELPAVSRPVVILGGNGAGKTTLVEGMVRALFGFDRRRGADAELLDARRPWAGESMGAAVTLERDGEPYEIRRDFLTHRVRVVSLDDGNIHFDGDGNPGGRNQEARHYRQILGDLLGLNELSAYRTTLFIQQGALPETELGEHLLRVAAGGHARVDAARREIAQAHRVITRRPLHSAASAAINPRELEKLDDEIASLRERLDAARSAGERRGPLALERDRIEERLRALDGEIERLEAAQSALARSGTVEMEARHLRDWTRKLERGRVELERAAEELDAARAQRGDAEAGGVFPEDFPERLTRAEVRWSDIESLSDRPGPWLAIAAALFLAGAIALLAVGYPIRAAGAAAAGLVAGLAWAAVHWDTRRRKRTLRSELAAALGDIPDADALSPDTRDDFRRRFRAQKAATERHEAARQELAETIRDLRSLLAEAKSSGLALASTDGAPESGAVRLMMDRLEQLAELARERMVKGRVELERVGDASLSLPDDVPPTEDEVTRALQQRRSERARVQDELQTVSQDLLERGTPSDSIDALESELAELLPRREALAARASVMEVAHALIADAYDAFRDRDQDRLVRHVSRQAERASAGRLSEIDATRGLEEAVVRLEDRSLPLSSPPLSFGELHALLLGVRLGAADFLAGVGIHPPLVVDEPFAHLDRPRASAVWAQLREVAKDRQVIVTTQDALLVDALAIEPDIRLGGGATADRGAATAPSPAP